MNNNIKISVEKQIKNIIISNLENPSEYKIFLFWSRAKWNYKKKSDYDIWIIWKTKLDFIEFIRLKSKLNELPYLIDLVDFNNVSEDFKNIALKHIKKWN